MTDPHSNPGGVAPAGWYADPFGAAQLRWWDGAQWTGHVSNMVQPESVQARYAQLGSVQPGSAQYLPQAQPSRPEIDPSVPVGTVWIWLVVLLPVLSVMLLPTIQVRIPVFDMNDPAPMLRDPFALIGGPWYFVLMGVSLLCYAAAVLFSWLDHDDLTRRGVVRPFHWAWSFLGGMVYIIGRTVIVRSVAQRRGMAPLWTMIGVAVFGFIVTVVWSVGTIAMTLQQLSYLAAYGV